MNKEDKIIDDGLKEIDEEIKQEDDIREKAAYVAQQLTSNKRIKVKNNDDTYLCSLKEYTKPNGIKSILLIAVNETKFKLFGPRYSPLKIEGEYNDEFTHEENVNTVVAAFIGKLHGVFKVEVLADEGIVKVKKQKV